MFPDIKYSEEQLLKRIDSTTAYDVENALKSSHCTFNDFLSLLSPVATQFIQQIREKAIQIRRMHFGKAVRLYAPIYFSSYCVNGCVYCGFRCSNKHERRRRLTTDEIIAEAEVLKSWGLDSLLLIAGEDPKAVKTDDVCTIIREMKKMFSYVSLELHQQDEESYRKLFHAGAHGLTIYQETYDLENYLNLHPSGPKRHYSVRIAAPIAAAKAGFYNVGIGALFGLYNWRSEAVSMAGHALAIRKANWRTRNQFSFPRITPMAGGFEVPEPVSENELEQMMLAFRIYFPEADIFVSTRERHEFRMSLAQSCASHISAGSKVSPGAYVESLKITENNLGQFTVIDDHSVGNVVSGLKNVGLEPVFKDWDSTLGAE